jgi:hypothetical protein
MDFDVAFHLVLVFDFADIFPARVSIVQHGVYLAEKSGLDVLALALHPIGTVHNPNPVGFFII